MKLSRQLHAAITAAQFLTRVPLPGGMNRPDPDRTLLRSAVVYFPVVGGLVGAFTGAVIWVSLQLWPPVIAVALGLIAEALLTGAFHEDAVADSCDAFGGGLTRDDVLRIMRDSRIGSFGALGLMLASLLRGGCAASVAIPELVMTVAASAAIGRWAILLLMATTPPVSNREGLAKDVGERIGRRELTLGSLLTLPGLLTHAWNAPHRTLLGIVAVLLVSLMWGRYVRWRIGGVTGDCLGCGCHLGQCVFLLVALAGAGR